MYYQLKEKATENGFVYVEVRKGIYGLPQAGLVAQELLEQRLAKYMYFQSKITPDFWAHKTRSFYHILWIIRSHDCPSMWNFQTYNLFLANIFLHVKNIVCLENLWPTWVFSSWTPLIGFFNAKDVNSNTTWMGSHFWHISVNFWICWMCRTLLKSSCHASIDVVASEFWASPIL